MPSFFDDVLFGPDRPPQTQQLPLLGPGQQNLNKLLLSGTQQDYRGAENLSLQGLEDYFGIPQEAPEYGAQQEPDQRTLDLIQEFFETNVQQPLTDAFSKDILPAITRQFEGNALFDTERAQAEGAAGEDLTRALAGQLAKLKYGAYEAQAGRAHESRLQTQKLQSATDLSRPGRLSTLAGLNPRQQAFNNALALLGVREHENIVIPGVDAASPLGDVGDIFSAITSFF